MSRLKILYVTDLYYEAKGRSYRDEDLGVIRQLRGGFDIAVCQPTEAESFLDDCDVVVVRNTGPVIHYAEAYASFRTAAAARGACVYNPLTGGADMTGKQYLVDLFTAGYPVIATVDALSDLDRLGPVDRYVVKPKLGSDSIGMFTDDEHGLAHRVLDEVLIQPLVRFDHEVSFYFIDHEYQYALYAPDTERRWELMPYGTSEADLAFAQQFIEWNALSHGIQRVDACRVADTGELLLMELEDLNPYLSLAALGPGERGRFVDRMAESIEALHAQHG